MKTKNAIAVCTLALCAMQVFAANTHTVTFRRLNGTILRTFEVQHGANATSLAPAIPAETGMTAQRWDHVEWLASVTNDVTCWALYEASTAKSPSTSIASQSVANRETPYSLEEYFKIYDHLAWSDEFSGSALSVGYGTGKNWQNDTEKGGTELQTYTSGGNHSVSDGTLKLTCKRESSTRITSARINTKGKVAFQKGRCEIRAKITKANGAFPAFWTMGSNRGWPWGGEIDVFEQLNGSDWITGSLHMPRYPNSNTDRSYESGGESLAVPEDGVRWGDGFHRIGIIVNERDLVWYVDDYIFQRMDIRDSKYDILRNDPQYILLNYAFGGGWSGVTNMNQAAAANFTSEDFEVDYCRIFTNTNANNTIARTEPAGVRLSAPVKATVWRGWQMRWGKSGASYYQGHLIGRENVHIRTATREYLGRDNADIVTFLTRTTANSGGNNLESPVDVPGYTATYLSPNSGRGSTSWDGDIREKLLGTVLFNNQRFSKSDSAVGTLQLSNDYSFTNGCAVVAELVERDTGAKVKVVSVFVSSIVGATTSGSVAKQGFDALISKLDAMKDEKVILLIQGWNNNCLEHLNNRVSSELAPSYSSLGQYIKSSYVYQSAWATANYVSASAENPAPLSVPKANGQASGVHTNQSFCATVKFDAEPMPEVDRILYVNVPAGQTNALNSAEVTEYITNIVKQGEGTLTATAIAGYEGDFTLEKGVFSVGVKNGAGKHGFANNIYVGPGASLEFTGQEDSILNNKKVVFEGAAASTAPAGSKFFNKGAWKTIGSGMSFEFRSDAKFAVACGNRMMISNSIFDLGGKTMTVVNSGGSQAQFNGATFRNGGHLVVGSNMTFMQEDGAGITFETPASGSPSVTLKDNATINLKRSVSASGWTLYATNSNTTVCGNRTARPNDVGNAVWNGRLVLGKSTKIASYQGSVGGVTNTVFNVKGGVSGSGTLDVGPGWLNLHAADNTFSGAVTVSGQSASPGAVLPGGGGIGLWNGAACFPNASSVTFTNTARLAFMDNTSCTVPNVKFVALAGETQSISGGVYTARSTMAGFTKVGAGTLVVDSPVEVPGLADIQAGTLKLANRINMQGTTQEEVIGPQPIVTNLQFAAGTTFDLSGAFYYGVTELKGAPCVTNGGIFAVTGKWTLTAPGEVLKTRATNVYFGEYNVAGGFGFPEGATFDLANEAAFTAAATAAGDSGILVADTHWIVTNGFAGVATPLPQPAASISPRWQMFVTGEGRELRLRLAPVSGYAAWIAEKGITGNTAPADVNNGIANGIRYAFDIDLASETVGEPIIKVVRDANGNPVVEARELATGRDDVTFGVLATGNLTNWQNASLIPMEKFNDGYWKPSESADSTYVYPAKMFFKYTVEVK